MITQVVAHRVSKAVIEGPFEYGSHELNGRYQRITLFDADGRETGVISIHFDDGAKPLPATGSER